MIDNTLFTDILPEEQERILLDFLRNAAAIYTSFDQRVE